MLMGIGFFSLSMISQLYMMAASSKLVSLLGKVTDDLTICGPSDTIDAVIKNFSQHFTPGAIKRDPGLSRFFGLNNFQPYDYSITTDCENNPNALETHPLTRVRRREIESKLDKVEPKTFASINSSVDLLDITVLPVYALFSSMFQHVACNGNVADLC